MGVFGSLYFHPQGKVCEYHDLCDPLLGLGPLGLCGEMVDSTHLTKTRWTLLRRENLWRQLGKARMNYSMACSRQPV